MLSKRCWQALKPAAVARQRQQCVHTCVARSAGLLLALITDAQRLSAIASACINIDE